MAGNKVMHDGRQLELTINSGVATENPVIKNYLAGVALTSQSSSAVSVDLAGVYDLSVKGEDDAGSAWSTYGSVGMPVYFTDADTPQLNLKQSGVFFGYLVEALTSSAANTVNVLLPHCPPPPWNKLHDDGVTASDSANTSSAMGSAAGFIAVTVGSSTRYIQLFEDTPS